jgi:glycosyltransferase involved in cell wall biosynthesis
MIITVVIPLYNKEFSVQRAIRSVLAQTYPDFELIIIDDGSTDRSFEIASEIADSRIRIIYQENRGVSSARNRGVAEASADLVAFLDADDEWHPEFLESIIMLITQFPDADVFGSSYYIQNNKGELTLPPSSTLFKEDWKGLIPNYLEIINTGYLFNSSSVAVKKQALERIDGFPVGVKYGEDVDTWIRLSLRSEIAHINKPMSIIYQQKAGNRACLLERNPWDSFYPVEELKHYLKSDEIRENQRQSVVEFIAKHDLPLAQTHLFYGNTEKARELIFSCGPTKKYIIKKYWLMFCVFIPPIILNSLIKFKHNVINPMFRKHVTS